MTTLRSDSSVRSRRLASSPQDSVLAAVRMSLAASVFSVSMRNASPFRCVLLAGSATIASHTSWKISCQASDDPVGSVRPAIGTVGAGVLTCPSSVGKVSGSMRMTPTTLCQTLSRGCLSGSSKPCPCHRRSLCEILGVPTMGVAPGRHHPAGHPRRREGQRLALAR